MNLKRGFGVAVAVIILIIAYGLVFPSKQYFACSEDGLIKHSLIVNKFIYGAYFTLDDYKFSQCATSDRAIDCENSEKSLIFGRLNGDLRREIKINSSISMTSYLNCVHKDPLVK